MCISAYMHACSIYVGFTELILCVPIILYGYMCIMCVYACIPMQCTTMQCNNIIDVYAFFISV